MTTQVTSRATVRRRPRPGDHRIAAWLRRNSEHYLLEAAQTDLARQLGRLPPVGATGPASLVWRHVFVPVYRRLPWAVRHRAMARMPGSHRRVWHPPPTRRDPAV
jgi:hypothetical protein